MNVGISIIGSVLSAVYLVVALGVAIFEYRCKDGFLPLCGLGKVLVSFPWSLAYGHLINAQDLSLRARLNALVFVSVILNLIILYFLGAGIGWAFRALTRNP